MTTTYNHLGAEERGAIMAMKLGGMSARSIGQTLARAPSTITRELLRNGYQAKAEGIGMGRPRIAGGYDAIRAGKRARRVRRAARRTRKLCNGSALWCRVRSMLDDFWSPQQIAAILKQEHPGQAALQASHAPSKLNRFAEEHTMNPRISTVTANADHSLTLAFKNGEIKRFDMRPYLDYPAFAPLQNIGFFQLAKADHGTVAWPQDIDFDPDTLYLDSQSISDAHAA